jgi:hypothetical protein
VENKVSSSSSSSESNQYRSRQARENCEKDSPYATHSASIQHEDQMHAHHHQRLLLLSLKKGAKRCHPDNFEISCANSRAH